MEEFGYSRMLWRLWWPLVLVLVTRGAVAQAPGRGGLQGQVGDSARHGWVELAQVSLLRSDTVVVAATRTGKEGRWGLNGIPVGHYRLIFSGSGLVSNVMEVDIMGGKIVDLGQIWMMPKTDLLQSVMVTPRRRPMVMRGDTLVYNTASMKVRVNETVEELLGRLPGLEVGADGTITYNGEVIKQLLVDGEDIFAMNPSVIARNFDASRIARVEVLDRKSDQARFSGVDDGSRTKTLNLVLKESSKEDYFGKIEGSGDPEGYYDANGLLASFRGPEQFAVLGLAANTGVTNVGGGTAGQISPLNVNADALGASAGKGVPQFKGVALHDVSTWNGTDDHLLGNYQYTHFFTQPVTSTYTVQALPDSVYTQSVKSRSLNRQDQHWGYGFYDYEPDSLSAIHVIFHGSWTDAHNQYWDTASSAWNGIGVNEGGGSIVDVVNRMNIGSSVGWVHRGRRRPGRTFSLMGSWTTIESETNGNVYSISRYNESNVQLVDTVDQRKAISDYSMTPSATISYVEPLSRGIDLAVTYWVQDVLERAMQGTYNKGDGNYNLYVDSLSSRYDTRALTQQGFITLQGGGARWKYMVSEGLQVYGFKLTDLSGDSGLRVRYFNAIPRIQVGHTPDAFTHWNLSFSESAQLPTSAQLQPVSNNTNPLILALGNPGLRPALLDNGSLEWKRVKVWVLNAALQVGWVQGAISTRTTTDSLGRQVSQPVNVNGGRSVGWNGSAERPLGGWQVGLHTNLAYGRAVNYVDAALSRTDSYTAGGGLTVRRFVPDQYAVQVNTQGTYFDTRSSVNVGAPVRYWSQSHRGVVSLLFVRGWELRSEAVYTWQGATSGLSGATSVLLWNETVNRNLFNGRLVIRIQANNLLNQNAGISRTSSANVNTESSTNVLGRYWMLGAVWRFDKHGKH